jgi:raffinose/stachyose/melibiose transport system permease protein
VVVSFSRWNYFDFEFIGFENYMRIFSNPVMGTAIFNTIVFAVGSAVAKIVIGLALGLLFSSRIFGRGYLRTIAFAPILVTTVGLGITWKALLNPSDGVVNGIFGWFGVDGPGWFTDPDLAIFALTFVDTWRALGLYALVYLAGLAGVPRDFHEAAMLDGASWWQRFWNITLPLLLPATTTVFVLSVVHGLRSWDVIWIVTQGGPGFSSNVLGSLVYSYYLNGSYGLSAAGDVVILAIVCLIVMPVFFLLTRRAAER